MSFRYRVESRLTTRAGGQYPAFSVLPHRPRPVRPTGAPGPGVGAREPPPGPTRDRAGARAGDSARRPVWTGL